MKIISRLICRAKGHDWGRAKRLNHAGGTHACKRCGLVETVAMKTPFGRKRDATEAQIRG